MSAVEWYMTDDHSARIVSYQWWPADTSAPPDPISMGTVYFMHRDQPGAVWSPPLEIGVMVLAVARKLAESEGFTCEVVSS